VIAMPYAVTLPLDNAAAAHVQRMWRALSKLAGDDDVQRLGYIPHITLALLSDTVPLDEVADTVRVIAKRWTAFSVVLVGIGVFPRPTSVVWVAPAMTQQLLMLHSELHAALSAFPVHPHYQPGGWVPHVTLSEKAQPSVARAIEIVTSLWSGPVSACLERIELVRFSPVELLRSEAFSSL
jgi:2'-5' RNA ligase